MRRRDADSTTHNALAPGDFEGSVFPRCSTRRAIVAHCAGFRGGGRLRAAGRQLNANDTARSWPKCSSPNARSVASGAISSFGLGSLRVPRSDQAGLVAVHLARSATDAGSAHVGDLSQSRFTIYTRASGPQTLFSVVGDRRPCRRMVALHRTEDHHQARGMARTPRWYGIDTRHSTTSPVAR